MKYQHILFDLDGTLTDSKIGITRSVQYALNYFNIESDEEDLCKFIGPPLMESFMKYYKFSEEDSTICIKKYREYFIDKGIFENEPYKGITDLLDSLKNAKLNLVVATSKPTVFAEKILRHFDLTKYFDIIGGSELDGTRSKKGEVIKFVLEEAGIKHRDKTVMIGDREHDMIGAKENAIDSIGVLYGYGDFGELHQAGAKLIAKDIPELKKFLMTD